MQAAGDLDLAGLKLALDYVVEIGVSLTDVLAVLLDFAEPEWLEELHYDTDRDSCVIPRR